MSGVKIASCVEFVVLVAVLVGAIVAGQEAYGVLGQVRRNQRVSSCADHLRVLGGAFTTDLEAGKLPAEGGARYLIDLADRHGLPRHVLACPGDPSAERVCSYAVRDFARYPLDPSSEREIVFADAGDHHTSNRHSGGVNVVLTDGGVRFFDRERLGLAPDDEIVTGPESPSPELRKLCTVPMR